MLLLSTVLMCYRYHILNSLNWPAISIVSSRGFFCLHYVSTVHSQKFHLCCTRTFIQSDRYRNVRHKHGTFRPKWSDIVSHNTPPFPKRIHGPSIQIHPGFPTLTTCIRVPNKQNFLKSANHLNQTHFQSESFTKLLPRPLFRRDVCRGRGSEGSML